MDRPGSVVRYAAASLTLLALTGSVGLFWNRQSNGVDSLEQAAADSVSAREQSLHYGSNYFANAFGVSGDLNRHWWCGHYFGSLCRRDGRDQTQWYQKTDWLDYSSRLKVQSRRISGFLRFIITFVHADYLELDQARNQNFTLLRRSLHNGGLFEIQAAHEADGQEEVAFHEAIKELHARVIAKRNATENLRQVCSFGLD
jgi:hypothetical protein